MSKKGTEIDWNLVESLKREGATYREISEMLGIPYGTLSAQKYRKSIAMPDDRGPLKKTKVKKAEHATPLSPVNHDVNAPVTVKEKTLDDFPPREIFKHLYKIGYRTEGKIYYMKKEYVNQNSVINE